MYSRSQSLVDSLFSAHMTAFFFCVLVALLSFASSDPLKAEEMGDKIHINAYLTQAWGKTDGTPFLGLDEDGTFDYRTAAVLFRFDLTEQSNIVLQLAHEELGRSPVQAFRDEIEVDWMFFQKRWDSGTRIRLGRLPIPYGIYNELRDVGTVLEFYRPPAGIYLESSFASDTLDGLALAQSFGAGTNWPIDVEVYTGSWDRIESVGPEVAEGRAEDAVGLQVWLGTPVTGLRLGFAHQRFTMEGGLIPRLRVEPSDHEISLFSIDGDFDRFTIRGEYQDLKTEFSFASEVSFQSYYVLVGFDATEKLSFNLTREDSTIDFSGGPFPIPSADPYLEDLAASVTYRFSSQLLLRAELHHAKITGSISDIQQPAQSFHDVDYTILSLSTSF